MPEISAVGWSAFAASFAALSSLLIMLIQHRNLIESIRPDLAIDGWGRVIERERDTLSFTTVENLGRGTAYHVRIDAFEENENRQPLYMLSSIGTVMIRVAGQVSVNGDIAMFWHNATIVTREVKHLPVRITLSYSDSRNRRYETHYRLVATDRAVGFAGPVTGVPRI